MGIFSFGKKDDDTPTRRGANTRTSRNVRTERVERRPRRTERTADADAMLLDPTLPEKQRARRRLVGAIALVIAAVIVLPMVLDSHPKPVTDDIAIDIPSRPAPKVAAADNDDAQAGVAPDNPAAPEAAPAASASATANTAAKPTQPTQTAQTSANAAAAAAAKPGKAPASSATASNSSNQTVASVKPAARPDVKADTKSAKPAPTPAQSTAQTSPDADSGSPASPPGSRFAVQLGVFPDEANARTWATRLKAAGVPAYTEHRRSADGTTQTLLRAGPFADRAQAAAAIAKVREAGLTSGANSAAQ
ncbi:SPOR domain-containing protein [Paraburkholderia sp.]|uniref:SPOR domain-containing protein n=1 Tax=Paraburkholderia sp. TaxID=1926495 RepID=UPI0023A337FF|nr:SPOR domain-containing protein [Paraburkholderia sp.]MDE1182064.1 SPOR domain-containing protein [Paraburkholderia sp.]